MKTLLNFLMGERIHDYLIQAAYIGIGVISILLCAVLASVLVVTLVFLWKLIATMWVSAVVLPV